MDILMELASFTDTEASQCLNRVLSSVKETDPSIPITSPDDLSSILQGTAAALGGGTVTPKLDANLRNVAKAERLLLLEFLEDPKLKERLQGALSSDRRVLIEPITTALVMAGIVMVLQTRFSMKYKKGKDGKSDFEVTIEKKESADGVIKKLFSMF